MNRISKTLYIVLLYDIAWILLELILYGVPKESPEDTIMLLLFIPVIYRAVKEK